MHGNHRIITGENKGWGGRELAGVRAGVDVLAVARRPVNTATATPAGHGEAPPVKGAELCDSVSFNIISLLLCPFEVHQVPAGAQATPADWSLPACPVQGTEMQRMGTATPGGWAWLAPVSDHQYSQIQMSHLHWTFCCHQRQEDRSKLCLVISICLSVCPP